MMVTGAAFGWPFFVCDDSLITFWVAQRPSPFLGRTGGPLLGAMEAPVVMVGSDALEVERRLLAGELVCPCGGGLSPWGHARQRSVRGVGDLRPRRARCGSLRSPVFPGQGISDSYATWCFLNHANSTSLGVIYPNAE